MAFLRPKLITGSEYSPDGVIKADSVICLRDPEQSITHSPHNLEDPRRTLESKTKDTKPKITLSQSSSPLLFTCHLMRCGSPLWCVVLVVCFVLLKCVFLLLFYFSHHGKNRRKKTKRSNPPTPKLTEAASLKEQTFHFQEKN